MSPRSREIRVGLVILIAMVVLAAGIFLIGDRNNLFSRKNRYYIEFNNVGGLKAGNPVQLNGVDVGTVERIELPQDPKRTQIRIWISVERKFSDRIRGPQTPRAFVEGQSASRARIKTLGLLGDKFIEISSGSVVYPTIAPEGPIPAAQPTNVDALLSSGEDVMDNVVEISSSLSKILARMERGEGLLGELTSNSPSGERLKTSLLGTSESLERIANKIETGDGPLPRLLNDRAMADQLARSLDRFEGLLTQAQTGPGLLPGLLNDPAAKARFDETLASLNQVARDLQEFTADLETSDALLPKLVKDEEYGREVTEEVRQFVERLNGISRKLSEGEGTAAKLINDPQIYDAVNDVIIGVNESRLLRWLIRNRQKAGIEKRYEDTKKAIEAEGGTPEPLSGQPEPPEPEPPADLEPPGEPASPPPAAI
jgi:phospholipid/cholesterol/gamma-HCH transport system substrate-binding protein